MKFSVLVILFNAIILNFYQAQNRADFGNKKQKKVEEILLFSKLCGYVKYFYPSDEAAELDWDAFTVYGLDRITKNNDKSIDKLLKELFLPIAPSLRFVNIKDCESIKDSLIENIQRFQDSKFLYWIHHGDGQLKDRGTYNSRRIEIDGTNITKDDYASCLDLHSTSVIIPHYIPVLNEELPKDHSETLSALLEQMKIIAKSYNKRQTEKEFIFGYLINAYNSIKFFYPYFAGKDLQKWDMQFFELIECVYSDHNKYSATNWLRLLLAGLNDAHVDVSKKRDFSSYPNLFIRKVEDKFTIYNTTEEYKFFKGSEVKKIDSKPIKEVIKDQLKFVSFKVEAFGYQEALRKVLQRPPFGSVKLELQNKIFGDSTIVVNCSLSLGKYTELGEYTKVNKIFSKIDNSTCYLNLIKLNSLSGDFKPEYLYDYDNIIIDLRGYPTLKSADIDRFLSFFLNQDDNLDWLFLPIVSKPMQAEIDYKATGWYINKHEDAPVLKPYILIDHMAISYAESIVGYFDNLPNSVLIGSPTAGANGNINRIELPNQVVYEYTGMKVLKHDGSPLHGIGFLPDVEVHPTIQGIIEGRDEVLEKAIELAGEESVNGKN